MAGFVPILIDQDRDAHLLVGDGDPRINGTRIFPGGSIFSSDDGAMYVSDGTQWFALGGGLTQAAADARYVQISSGGYLTQTVADTRYASLTRAWIPVADTRTIAVLPGTYSPSLTMDFKQNTTMGLNTVGATGTYSAVATIVPWTDDSGGPSFELAFNASGLFLRNGTRAAGWATWTQLATMAAVDALYFPRAGGNITGMTYIITSLGTAGSYSTAQLQLRAGDSTGDVAIGFHRPGSTACALVHRSSDPNGLYLVGTGTATANFHADTIYGTTKLTAPAVEGTTSVLGGNYFTFANGVYVSRPTAGIDTNRGVFRHNFLQFGGAGQNTLLIGNSAAGGFLDVYANVTADFNATSGVGSGVLVSRIFANGHVSFGSNVDSTYQVSVTGSIYATSWVRVTGTAGFYFETYAGGLMMSDTTYIRTYNSKSFYIVAGDLKLDTLRMIDIGGTQIFGATSKATYGSLQISAAVGGYAGFYFVTVARYLMWNAQYQGSYTGTVWQWRFNNGALDLVASIACQGAISAVSLAVTGGITAGAAIKQNGIDVAKIIIAQGADPSGAPASGIGTIHVRWD